MEVAVQGNLSISFEELRSKGQALVAKSEQQQGELSSIHAAAQPDGIWEGAAATEYKATFERWTEASRVMLESLAEMGQYLGAAADAYEQAETQIQSGIRVD